MTLVRMFAVVFDLMLLNIIAAIQLNETDPPPSYWLLFESDRDGYWQIFKMRLDGYILQKLTTVQGYYSRASWSPDGEWIAFESNRDNVMNIFRIRPDGSDLTQLTDKPANDVRPNWSPLFTPLPSMMLIWAIAAGLLVFGGILTVNSWRTKR